MGQVVEGAAPKLKSHHYQLLEGWLFLIIVKVSLQFEVELVNLRAELDLLIVVMWIEHSSTLHVFVCVIALTPQFALFIDLAMINEHFWGVKGSYDE